MREGSIVQFKPDIFKDRSGINSWALRACEKGTLFTVISVSERTVKASPIDDEEISSMLGKENIQMQLANIQEIQSQQSLKEMRNAGVISDKDYLSVLSTIYK